MKYTLDEEVNGENSYYPADLEVGEGVWDDVNLFTVVRDSDGKEGFVIIGNDIDSVSSAEIYGLRVKITEIKFERI